MRNALDESLSILPEPSFTCRYKSPESRLAAAVIEQAIADSNTGVASSLRRSALKWLRGAPALLSFDHACALAGIDLQVAREIIARAHGGNW